MIVWLIFCGVCEAALHQSACVFSMLLLSFYDYSFGKKNIFLFYILNQTALEGLFQTALFCSLPKLFWKCRHRTVRSKDDNGVPKKSFWPSDVLIFHNSIGSVYLWNSHLMQILTFQEWKIGRKETMNIGTYETCCSTLQIIFWQTVTTVGAQQLQHTSKEN